MDYEQLLEKAESELPETTVNSERFNIEKIKGHIEGSKTILSNFNKISRDVHREPEHMLKFLLRELATPGKFSGERVILGAKISASHINKKIKQYIGEYVLCPECGKPDTKLIKKATGSIIKCSACGVERQVKSI